MLVNGGTATWDAVATNWTNAAGNASFAWLGGLDAIFQDLTLPPDKDPSQMGFKAFTKLIQQAVELDLSRLMLHKLDL